MDHLLSCWLDWNVPCYGTVRKKNIGRKGFSPKKLFSICYEIEYFKESGWLKLNGSWGATLIRVSGSWFFSSKCYLSLQFSFWHDKMIKLWMVLCLLFYFILFFFSNLGGGVVSSIYSWETKNILFGHKRRFDAISEGGQSLPVTIPRR